MTKQERLWLAAHALGVSTAGLLACPERMDAPEVRALLQRREAGEPLQYILGEAPFLGRDFRVGPGVLVPRQDTETLITAVRSFFPADASFAFLDWGTGSGCIAATLLLEFPNSTAILAERSPLAIGYARRNLERYHLENRASVLKTETPEDIVMDGECDFVVSNPPYIPTGEIGSLMREVRDYEPREALDGGLDGLDCYRALFVQAPRWLKPGGLLILEMGVTAPSDFDPERFSFVRDFKDGSGFPRCAVWKCVKYQATALEL